MNNIYFEFEFLFTTLSYLSVDSLIMKKEFLSLFVKIHWKSW